MSPVCYLPEGHTRTPCGKNPAHVPHTNDSSQATCPACYKALTDGYARVWMAEIPLVENGTTPKTKLFDLDTVN